MFLCIFSKLITLYLKFKFRGPVPPLAQPPLGLSSGSNLVVGGCNGDGSKGGINSLPLRVGGNPDGFLGGFSGGFSAMVEVVLLVEE